MLLQQSSIFIYQLTMKAKSKTSTKSRRPIIRKAILRPTVYTTKSCEYCECIDTDDMVQCDSCDSWFHFGCVGVTQKVASEEWKCDRCKYVLPKNPSVVEPDKENVSPQDIQWRKSKSIQSLSSVSSTRSKALALRKLEEERALTEKRDREYLNQKYSILEETVLDNFDVDDEKLEKSSFESTLRWANEVQQLSKEFDRKFNTNNVSISLTEDERTALGQQFFPQASSTNVNQRSSLFPNVAGAKSKLSEATDRREKSMESQNIQPKNVFKSTTDKTITPRPSTSFGNLWFNSTEASKQKPLQSTMKKLQTTTFRVNDSFAPKFKSTWPLKTRTASKLLRYDPTSSSESDSHIDQTTQSCKFHSNIGLNSNDLHNDYGSVDGSRGAQQEMNVKFNRFPFTTVNPTSSDHGITGYQQPNTKNHSSKPATNPTRFQSNPNDYGPSASNIQSISHSHGQLVDYNDICRSYVDLTANMIAARHTMNRKLPQFSGEPTKWQMFESAFINATLSCGLNNSENLSRLMESLKGKAFTAVQCRLLHPDSVPGVMSTLRLLFGRPELIIHTLLDDINQTPSPKSEDLGSLIEFSIAVQNLCSTVKSYNAVEHLRNPTLMKALTDKLPSQIQLNWAFYKCSIGNANLSTLGDWLYQIATVASDVVTTIDSSANINKARKEAESSKNKKSSDNYINVQNGVKSEASPKTTHSSTVTSSKSGKKCPACKKDFCKVLAYCEEFKKLKRQDKWKLVKSNNLCGCCLGNHRYFNCQQKVQCGVSGCGFFHHVLLHNDANTNESAKRVQNADSSQKTCNVIQEDVFQSDFPDIFRIVPVKLFFNGKSIKIYAYLDDGSNLTTLTLTVANKLGLRGTKESFCVKWTFGDRQVESSSSRVSVQICGVHDGAELFVMNDVRTVNELILPMQSITEDWLRQYSYFNGIPITPYKNATPQLIIGLRHSKLMISLETIEGDWEQPLVCRTRLGWVVQGPNDKEISTVRLNQFRLNACECQSSDNNLHQMVKGFFSFESFDVKISENVMASKELLRAQNILESSTIKKENHYEVALLWRKDGVTLPHSYNMAKSRLECVESKMKRNPDLAKRICEYFKDCLRKNYIRKLTHDEQQRHGPRTWYLPVFPVFNPKRPEKLRLVWDGAAKVKGISLNSELMAGPDQLVPLPDILRRFREACIGLSTDIIEMFHRIFVNENDQDSQRFLWRDGNTENEPDVFVVKVLPFGSSCSPAIAQFVKNKNAKEFESEFPRAVEAITKNHYVDDMIERAHDVESAVQLVKDVQFIHRHANFDLRNLISNNQQVLEAINGSPEFSDKILVDKLGIDIERILGMYWNTKTDTFTYSLQFIKLQHMTEEYCPTKREVLRIVMSVFDPLGFLAHLLIHAKVLLQEIWRHDIGWDVQLPPMLKNKWLDWVRHLMKVEHLHIPRFYSARLSPNRIKSIQLHVFVDASTEAYATSAYFRIEDEDGVDSNIVGAKSRVASNRPISIPRLELQGAVLGNRFAESILKSHYSLEIDKTVIWCDSKTVLFWLNSEPRRYTQFVALRIGEILDSKINVQWRWIPSEFNVADEATKTKILPDLKPSSRWFVGPEFLRDRNPDFTFELDEPNFITEEEVRPYYLLTHMEVPVSKLFDYERFSNWQRLLRAMAYVLRFIGNSKLKLQERSLGILSDNELLAATNCLYRQSQFDCFKDELLIVRWNKTAPLHQQKDYDKTSIIRTCSPYLDDFGVLRVMGRLDNAHSISESAKHPIILAKDHLITHLIVDWYHRKYLHLHHQTVLNEIRQIYWIPKLRVVLNGIRNSCQKCKNASSAPKIPEMGSIPTARLAVHTRPFTFVGLDYFGPLNVIVNRGVQKRWGALFTCMTTRAVHLEVAHSMDTSSCIMAIRNFQGRRGSPRKYFSDNGTNFHGAHNVFVQEFANLDHDKIREEFVTSETSWSFNPPKAAHMGGIWERMVGIVKNCLDEVLTVRYPTDEMLKSLFIEVENMVNSRPLTYVSLESPDDEVLTPNHFLLGSSSGQKPPGHFTDADLLRNNWRAIQMMSDKFWKKFVDEYLPTLTRRTKWFRKVEPLKVGDVVILVDSSFQRNTWPKGIIIETFMDKTGQVRSARVRTATGTIYHRPVSHLAVLDVVEPGQVKLNSPNQLTGERMFESIDNTGPSVNLQ